MVVALAALASCGGGADGSAPAPAYVLERPSSDEPAALILAFHATGADADRFAEISRLHEHASDAAVVYLEGVDGRWTDADVERAADVVDSLAEDGVIDPDRVHLVGFSGGGAMALRIAAEQGASYAGVAAVASQLPTGVSPTAPIPAVILYGSDDPLRPFDGLDVAPTADGPIPTIGTLETAMAFAGTADEPVEAALSDGDPDDGTTVRHLSWRAHAPVDLYVVDGGGHTWPGTAVRTNLQRYGRTSADVDASAVIVDFFREHGAL